MHNNMREAMQGRLPEVVGAVTPMKVEDKTWWASAVLHRPHRPRHTPSVIIREVVKPKLLRSFSASHPWLPTGLQGHRVPEHRLLGLPAATPSPGMVLVCGPDARANDREGSTSTSSSSLRPAPSRAPSASSSTARRSATGGPTEQQQSADAAAADRADREYPAYFVAQSTQQRGSAQQELTLKSRRSRPQPWGRSWRAEPELGGCCEAAAE